MIELCKIPFGKFCPGWHFFCKWAVSQGIGPAGNEFDDRSYWAWIKGLKRAGYQNPKFLLLYEGEIITVLSQDEVNKIVHTAGAYRRLDVPESKLSQEEKQELEMIHDQTDALSAAKIAIENVSPNSISGPPSPFDPVTEYAEHMLLAASAHVLSRKMVQLAERRRQIEQKRK